MNYLAHLHLAHVTNTSLLGNFLGDFVKGSDLSHLAPELQRGVRLHRSIDSFTDSNPCVISLKQGFPDRIRRMSGVVIDIYFDHVLSTHWENYNYASMPSLLATFYEQLATTSIDVGGRYPEVKKGLLNYKWLHEYEQKEAVIRAFYQIEKRLKHRIIFATEAADFLEKYEDELHLGFHQFYPQLLKYCHNVTTK